VVDGPLTEAEPVDRWPIRRCRGSRPWSWRWPCPCPLFTPVPPRPDPSKLEQTLVAVGIAGAFFVSFMNWWVTGEGGGVKGEPPVTVW